jgi:apolipoprotein N-acyltransferase
MEWKPRLWTRAVRAWPIALSAALLHAGYPPLNLGWLAFFALAPWLASLKGATAWGAFRSGYTFGVLFWLWQFQFVQALTLRWTESVPLSLIPYLLGVSIGALYFAALGWAANVLWRVQALWVFPLVWAGMEVMRSYVPGLAFPWALSATPLAHWPALIQLAYYGTAYAVSAWVVLANVAAARALAGERPAAVLGPALSFGLLATVSLARYAAPASGETVKITVGQPGVDLAFSLPEERDARLRLAVAEIYSRARSQGSSLIVLPEGVASAGDSMPPSTPFVVESKPAVLFGGSRGTQPMFQSAFAFDGAWRYADKMRLVVFGEYIPARDVFPFLDSFRLPTGDLTPSDRVSALEVGGIVAGPLLCFEALFYDVALAQAKNGSQFLAAMCIDDWYAGTMAPEQLRDASVFRAVETGLPMVRSASLGWSIAVDPRGRVLARARWGETAALPVDLIVPRGADRFVAAELFPWLFAISWLAPAASALLLRFRGRAASTTD